MSAQLPIAFRIDPADERESMDALQSFRRNRTELLRHMRRYPLIVEFARYQFVLERESDIDRLVDWLEDELARLATSASRHAGFRSRIQRWFARRISYVRPGKGDAS